MKKMFCFFFLFLFTVSAWPVTSYETLAKKAANHYENRAWRESLAIYDLMLDMKPRVTDVYIQAILASSLLEDNSSVMKYVEGSEKNGIPLEDIFKGVDAKARRMSNSGIYENMLRLIKEKQPWFSKLVNNYLLNFYQFRNDASKTLIIADELLVSSPDNVEYLKAKANAFFILGNDSSAITIYKNILTVEATDFDAASFLGNFYAQQGMDKLRSIDEDFGKISSPTRMQYHDFREQKREVIANEIDSAKIYLNLAFQQKKTPYLQEVITQLESLSDRLSYPAGKTNVFSRIKKSKQE